MLLLAASALEKASALPSSFWLKIGLGIAAFFLAVFIIKYVARTNKVVMGVVVVVGVMVIFANWVYERNEPKFLTPVVDFLAPFLPSKGAYETRQASDPTAPGLKKNPAPKPTPAR